jgi:hypothetical protein
MARTPNATSSRKSGTTVTEVGNGGETHQQIPHKAEHDDGDTHLTTNQGIRDVSGKHSSTRLNKSRGVILDLSINL